MYQINILIYFGVFFFVLGMHYNIFKSVLSVTALKYKSLFEI